MESTGAFFKQNFLFSGLFMGHWSDALNVVGFVGEALQKKKKKLVKVNIHKFKMVFMPLASLHKTLGCRQGLILKSEPNRALQDSGLKAK